MSLARTLSLVVLAGLLAARPAVAQTDHNAHAWLDYFGDHPLGASRFEAHLEAQVRRAELGASGQQLLLRPGVNYQLRPRVSLTGGYGFVETYPYGDYPVARRFPEHRLFEQVQVTPHGWGLDWQNRFRLEQRHIGGAAARYENRFRYMLRTNVPVGHGGRYYLSLYDEVFYNFGAAVAENTFDQNRAAVMVGRSLTKSNRFEVGFMEQTLQHRDGRVMEHNHTLQVALYSRVPFGPR